MFNYSGIHIVSINFDMKILTNTAFLSLGQKERIMRLTAKEAWRNIGFL